MKILVLGGIAESSLLAAEICRGTLEQMVWLLGGDGGGRCDVLLVDRQRQRLAHLES